VVIGDGSNARFRDGRLVGKTTDPRAGEGLIMRETPSEGGSPVIPVEFELFCVDSGMLSAFVVSFAISLLNFVCWNTGWANEGVPGADPGASTGMPAR
jgi:hypothetical protein